MSYELCAFVLCLVSCVLILESYELYDILGNKVMNSQLLSNNNKVNVSTKNLNQGIYFYKIKRNKDTIASDKLVIIK